MRQLIFLSPDLQHQITKSALIVRHYCLTQSKYCAFHVKMDHSISVFFSFSVNGISHSVPAVTTAYGSVVLSPGVVISPGGNSFGQRINRASTRRHHRRMTRPKGRRVVHRNETAPNANGSDSQSQSGTTSGGNSSQRSQRQYINKKDENDPIKEHRVQPKYLEIASASGPGAEIVRYLLNSVLYKLNLKLLGKTTTYYTSSKEVMCSK